MKNYDCVIDYHPGKANVIVDALSRKETIELWAIFTQLRIGNNLSLLAELKVKPVLFEKIKETYLVDVMFLGKREMVQRGLIENFNIDDKGCLRFRNRIFVSMLLN